MVKATLEIESLRERLADCKQYLLNEERSSNPSKYYIEDLKLTIVGLEKRVVVLSRGYEVVK